MSRSKQSAVNMITSGGGFILPIMINFFITPILLKFLGEEGYGLQSLMLVISGYFAIMDLGIDIPITKYLAEDHAKDDKISVGKLLNTTFVIYIVMGLLGACIIFFMRDLLADSIFKISPDQRHAAVVVFVLSGVGFALNTLTSWGMACLNGLQRYDIANIIRVATMFFSSVVGLLAVYFGYGVIGFVVIRVIGYALSALFCLYYPFVVIPYFKFRPYLDVSIIRRVAPFLGMGLLLRASGFVVAGLDRTFIGMWTGVASVAVYSVIWNVITPTIGLMNSVFNFFFPLTSELHGSGDFDQLRSIFLRTSKFQVAMVFLIFPLLIIFGNEFLRLWVGDSIAEQAKWLLPMLIVCSMFGNLALGLLNEVAVGMGKVRAFAIYSMIKAAVLAISLALFINLFGLVGAGIAYLVTSGVDILFSLFVLKKYLCIDVVRLLRVAYAMPFVLSAVMCVVGLFLRQFASGWGSLTMIIGCLSFLYIAGGFLTKVFGDTEKRIIIHFRNVLLRPIRKIGLLEGS